MDNPLRKLRGDESEAVPEDVKARLKRGRDRLQQLSATRQVAIEFANGNHFCRVSDDKLKVVPESTVAASLGGEMPDQRVRQSHDRIGPMVKRKVSGATQRIPAYEVTPTTKDPEDYAAARLGERVAESGYETWRLKRAFKKLVWNALVTDEGFIMASWDSSVGPFIDVSHHPDADKAVMVDDGEGGQHETFPHRDAPDPENPQYIGMGEARVDVFTGLEVLREPGIDFEESPWYAIERARPPEQIEAEEGFMGPKLKPDAAAAPVTTPGARKATNGVMETRYFERPCPKYPKGRYLILANGRQIFPEDHYPLRDHRGEVVDAPCLHRLAYQIDGASDHDRGMVTSLIDPQRAYDYAMNKAAEYMAIGMVAQGVAPEGSVLTELTDEPGLLIELDQTRLGDGEFKWREQIRIPPEIFNVADRMGEEMSKIGFDSEIPAGIESGKGIQSIYDRDNLAWQDFIFDLAEVHARVMRDLLTLVQLHYSEDRMVQFRGRTGWENIPDFKGADLRGQTDVRVQPGSLEPRTRGALEARILRLAQLFPKAFPPEVVIAALNSAQPDKLVESYEEDVSRANRLIGQIKAGTFEKIPDRPVMPGEEAPELDPRTGEILWEEMPEVDPESGEPIPGTGKPKMLTRVSGWMARPFDNVPVQRSVFESWMKTEDFDRLGDEETKAALLVYQSLLDLEARQAKRKSMLEDQVAEEHGRENAAREAPPKGSPSPPGEDGEEEGPEASPAGP